MGVIASKTVETEDQYFEMFIIKYDGKWLKKPCLEMFKHDEDRKRGHVQYVWDNEVFLKKMFKAIENKSKNRQTKILKSFCRDHALRFKETKKQLLELYKESKKLKMWE